MVRVWVAVKTVWSPCYTQPISEHFRDKGLIIKRYINSSAYFTFCRLLIQCANILCYSSCADGLTPQVMI